MDKEHLTYAERNKIKEQKTIFKENFLASGGRREGREAKDLNGTYSRKKINRERSWSNCWTLKKNIK